MPVLAGVAYSLSWVGGLLIFSSSTDVRSRAPTCTAT